MTPETPREPLPDGAGPELRKLAADVDDALHRMDGEVEQIDADVRKLEQIEQEMRRKALP
jgi:hypothetical protein